MTELLERKDKLIDQLTAGIEKLIYVCKNCGTEIPDDPTINRIKRNLEP